MEGVVLGISMVAPVAADAQSVSSGAVPSYRPPRYEEDWSMISRGGTDWLDPHCGNELCVSVGQLSILSLVEQIREVNVPETTLIVNGERRTTEEDPRTPLLWVLRDSFKLTGTKYGCGIGQCGACTVILDGDAVRSCLTPLSRAAGNQVTTIEGLSRDRNHPVQRAWVLEQVPQCGYCQSGQIMAAVVLLRANAHPSDNDINEAMNGNLCRCGTYHRIRRAVHRAAELSAGKTAKP